MEVKDAIYPFLILSYGAFPEIIFRFDPTWLFTVRICDPRQLPIPVLEIKGSLEAERIGDWDLQNEA
jgi:hypothetical protein